MLFGSEKNKGCRARHRNQSCSHPPKIELTTPLCLHCYERGKPSSPELGTLKYPTLMFFTSHLSSIPKYYLEVVVRFYFLTTNSKPFFSKQKWQFGIVQFLGVISTISVSLLSMRTMLQHIIPLAYGSV